MKNKREEWPNVLSPKPVTVDESDGRATEKENTKLQWANGRMESVQHLDFVIGKLNTNGANACEFHIDANLAPPKERT